MGGFALVVGALIFQLPASHTPQLIYVVAPSYGHWARALSRHTLLLLCITGFSLQDSFYTISMSWTAGKHLSLFSFSRDNGNVRTAMHKCMLCIVRHDCHSHSTSSRLASEARQCILKPWHSAAPCRPALCYCDGRPVMGDVGVRRWVYS